MTYFKVMHFFNTIVFRRIIFSRFLLFSGVALPSSFTKSSKFKESFNDNELLLSFSRSFYYVMSPSVLVQQARNVLLLDNEFNRKIVLQHSMKHQYSSPFANTCNLNRKIVTFNRNP